MSQQNSELFQIKTKLLDTFDEETKKLYLKYLNQFFRGLSLQIFFSGAKPLLKTNEQMILHNQLINEISKNGFVYCQDNNPSTNGKNFLFLPKEEMIRARILMASWIMELDLNVNFDVPELIMDAIKIFIKNIISVILTTHKGFQVHYGRFQTFNDQSVPNPWLNNSNQLPVPDNNITVSAEDENYILNIPKLTIKEIEMRNFVSHTNTKRPNVHSNITLPMLYKSLKSNRHVIKNGALYLSYLEQISLLMTSPNN